MSLLASWFTTKTAGSRDSAGILSQDEGDIDRLYIAELSTQLGLTSVWKYFAAAEHESQNSSHGD